MEINFEFVPSCHDQSFYLNKSLPDDDLSSLKYNIQPEKKYTDITNAVI